MRRRSRLGNAVPDTLEPNTQDWPSLTSTQLMNLDFRNNRVCP